MLKINLLSDIAEISKGFEGMTSAAFKRAVADALNRGMGTARLATSKGVRARFKSFKGGVLTAKELNDELKVGGIASPTRLETSFSIRGRRKTLGFYGKSMSMPFGRQDAPPKFQVTKGGKSQLPFSFAAPTSSLTGRPLGEKTAPFLIVSRIGGNMGAKYQKNVTGMTRDLMNEKTKGRKKKGNIPGVQSTALINTPIAAFGAIKKVKPTKGRYAGKVHKRGPFKGQPILRQPIEILRQIARPEMFNTKLVGGIYSRELTRAFRFNLESRLTTAFKQENLQKFRDYEKRFGVDFTK
jgi:hypothetical protein